MTHIINHIVHHAYSSRVYLDQARCMSMLLAKLCSTNLNICAAIKCVFYRLSRSTNASCFFIPWNMSCTCFSSLRFESCRLASEAEWSDSFDFWMPSLTRSISYWILFALRSFLLS